MGASHRRDQRLFPKDPLELLYEVVPARVTVLELSSNIGDRLPCDLLARVGGSRGSCLRIN